MDAPICPTCGVRPREWKGGSRNRWGAYCKPCHADRMKAYRDQRKAAGNPVKRSKSVSKPVAKKRGRRETVTCQHVPDDLMRVYRLRIIARAHRAALARRCGPAHE